MIKANELRIGNWLLYKGQYVKYDGSYSGIMGVRNALLIINGNTLIERELKECSTIELTPDILIKCGFVRSDRTGFTFYALLPLVYNTNHGWWLYNKKMGIPPKYLHQLQNLYFALTGEELEINLS